MVGTILRKLPISNPDSIGITPIVVTDDDKELFDHPNVLHWFRVSQGFDRGTAWTCRKSGKVSTAQRSAWPVVQTIAAYGGKPSLLVAGFNDTLWDNGQLFLPTGDFSVASYGRAGPNDDAFIWGTGGADGTEYSNVVQQGNTGGGLGFTMRTASKVVVGTQITTATYPRLYADGPNLLIASRQKSSGQVALRINRGAYTTPVVSGGAGEDIFSRSFKIGEAGNGSGVMANGDVAEFIICNVALHLPENTHLRDLIERVVGDYYGMAAP